MPDDLEQLERKLEEGLRAVRELKRLKVEEQRKHRPKLKIVKGSAIGAAVWAGVEWLLGTRKVALAFTAVSLVTGGVIADRPGSPSADPPVQESIVAPPKPKTQPPEPRPSKPPKVTPGPSRTSPPRATKTPTKAAAKTPSPRASATTQTPKRTASAAIPVTPSLPLTPSLAPEVTAETTCTGVDLLGLCLLGK